MTIEKKSNAMRFLEKRTGGPLSMAKLLEATRNGEGWSQAELAEKLGVSRSVVCDIEHGRRFVSAELAERFALKLGKSKTQFVRIALQDQLHRAKMHYCVDVKAA